MLSNYELEKYQRQIILKDIGIKGQEKLFNSKVLVVGLGGLGSVVSLYLVAAGIGYVGLMDKDIVSLHNLHRQVLYREDEIGQKKTDLAVQTLKRLNKNVNLIAYDCFLEESNAKDIIKNFDIIVDCTDNYKTRYLINDTCVLLNKPFIYGSIGQTQGQLAVLNYKKPCADYRTLFPNKENTTLRDNTNKGVLGTLPSVIGSLQANEVIKMITNTGIVLKDTLFIIDLQNLETTKFKLPTK